MKKAVKAKPRKTIRKKAKTTIRKPVPSKARKEPPKAEPKAPVSKKRSIWSFLGIGKNPKPKIGLMEAKSK
jgi:hypothetical protein